MQVPILNGIYTDSKSDFRVSYPHNLIPVPVENGISNGYLRPADGIVTIDDNAPGYDRGAINWNGVCYRVSGTSLVKVTALGTVIELATIPGTDQVTFDYSFDYLGIAADSKLYLWNGSSLQQVTDPDLGVVVDLLWVDGYFMTTDGGYIVVTDLNDPFSVNPTKYGSSEADPDPVKALIKVRNEPFVLNRYTIEVFDNIGGVGFPFQRIDGAQIQRGVIGTHACCLFLDGVAFVGGGRNESIAVWAAELAQSAKISTHEIDLVLASYTEEVLSKVVVENKVDLGHQHLHIHLPDQTLVFDGTASRFVGEPIWFTLGSGLVKPSAYRARNFIWCYNKWLVGDPIGTSIGYLSTTDASHWGSEVNWEFLTSILYNEGRGAIFHEVELIGLTGRVELGVSSTISTQYSLDGIVWSQEKFIAVGNTGNRKKRLVWLNQGHMNHWRIQKFCGTSTNRLSISRLDIRLEGLTD